jgi:hypothetical protein
LAYGYGVQRHFQQYFSYIVAAIFIGGGNQSTRNNIVQNLIKARRGRDRLVVGFITTYVISAITTNVVSSNPAQARCTNNKFCTYLSTFQIAVFFKWNDMIFSYEDLE